MGADTMTETTQNTASFWINTINRVGAPLAFFAMAMWYMPQFLEGLVQNGKDLTHAVHVIEQSNAAIVDVQNRQTEVLERLNRGQDTVIRLLETRPVP